MQGKINNGIWSIALGLMLLVTACTDTPKETIQVPTFAHIEFPAFMRGNFERDLENFSKLKQDSARIHLLFDLALKNPVYRSNIYRYLISQTNDSTNYKHRLYAVRKLAGTFIPSNKIDSVTYYCQLGINNCGNNPKYSFELSEFYRDLGNVYVNFSRNDQAIFNFDKAIQVAAGSRNKENLFRYITEIGRAYLNMNEIEKAGECYEKGKAFAEKHNDQSLLVYTLNSLGDLCRLRHQFDKSIEYHKAANEVNKKHLGFEYEQWACTSLGKSYAFLKDYDNARKYFKIAMDIASKQGSTDIETQAYLNISICDFRQNLLKDAIKNGLLAYEISAAVPNLDLKVGAAQNLSILYKKNNQFEKALYFHEIYKVFEDSMENSENIKKFAEAEYKSREDKLLIKIEQDKQHLKHEQEKREQETRRHRLIIISVTLVLLLSVAFAIYVFRSLQQIRIKNRIIEEKQGEILESIHYARRIQHSLLPTEKYIDRIIKKLKKN